MPLNFRQEERYCRRKLPLNLNSKRDIAVGNCPLILIRKKMELVDVAKGCRDSFYFNKADKVFIPSTKGDTKTLINKHEEFHPVCPINHFSFGSANKNKH